MTTVRICNLSPHHFTGWRRVLTSDVAAPSAGADDGMRFVRGRRVGIGVAIDVHVDLAPGVERAWTLRAGEAPVPPALPPDLLAHFGGLPVVNGVPMGIVFAIPDGACWYARFRARTGTMLVHDLWCWWYPGQGWCRAEWRTTCSNPAIDQLAQTTSQNGVRLVFGDAIVHPVGGAPDGLVVAASTRFADGQSRIVPVLLAWLRHCSGEDIAAARAVMLAGVWGRGIDRLLPDGNPMLPPGFDARGYIASKLPDLVRGLHTWEPPVVGPSARSTVTGAQEDQVFVRGEIAAHPAGTAVAYLGALAMAKRPCHHRETSGQHLVLSSHPLLRFWDGRAHYSIGVSPDQLGKPRALREDEVSGGFWGPDVEHWLINTLAAGASVEDSPALQSVLEDHAQICLLQWTVAAGLPTSQPYAARAIGWEGIAVVHLWRTLEDRALASTVMGRWLDRWERIISPNLWAPGETSIIDIRVDDPRLGPGRWWMPWQQAVAAYGLDLVGAEFQVPLARTMAFEAARRVVADAWVEATGADAIDEPGALSRYRQFVREEIGQEPSSTDAPEPWLTRATMPVDGGGVATGDFNFFGMVMAPAVVLRHVADERARSIWNWLLANATQLRETSWLAPGVPQ